MKYNFLYKKSLLCAVFILLLAVVGCEKTVPEPPEPEPTSPLRGTSWQLIGFGDTQTGTFREIERECESHFTLKFDGYTLFVWLIENEFISFYSANYETGRLIRELFHHSFLDSEPDGEELLFYKVFWARNLYFAITTRGELRLFGRDENIYLLFESQQPEPIEPIVSLSRTSWRLAGIVNRETGILRKLEGQEDYYPYIYRLSFGNKIFVSISLANEQGGGYIIDYEMSRITNTHTARITSRYRPGDNHLFESVLRFMHSFSLTDNELRLYIYNLPLGPGYCLCRFECYDELNNSYLLFKRIGL